MQREDEPNFLFGKEEKLHHEKGEHADAKNLVDILFPEQCLDLFADEKIIFKLPGKDDTLHPLIYFGEERVKVAKHNNQRGLALPMKMINQADHEFFRTSNNESVYEKGGPGFRHITKGQLMVSGFKYRLQMPKASAK